jgi:type II secretory pathway component PulF
MEATATPFFSYDVSHSNIDPSLLEDKTFTVSTSYFQMPWLILIIVVLVILFLIVAFRKPK